MEAMKTTFATTAIKMKTNNTSIQPANLAMMDMITALSPRKPKEELISHQAKVTDDYEVWEGKVKE
jgi:hypothetical protein